MGSATREALNAARAALKAKTVTAGEELFAAGRTIGDSKQLLAAVTDQTAPEAKRAALVEKIFSSLSAETRASLTGLVSSRWSENSDLLAAIEELGIRVMAASSESTEELISELYAFAGAVGSDPELELAVNSKLGTAENRARLVSALVSGKASEQTEFILRHLVQQPRGRRIGGLIKHAATVIAEQSDRRLATVTSAQPLTDAQVTKLRASLAHRYGELHSTLR